MKSHAILSKLDAVVALLRKHGFRFFSPWWRAEVIRFYLSGAKRMVLRVGRRGGKSMLGALIAVLEILYGEHAVPRGNVGWFAFLSVSRDEASQRIRMIKAMLDALGVDYAATSDTIELTRRNRGARVFSTTISGTAGFDCIGVWFDEMAKAPHDDASARPADEVLAGIVPSTVTYPNARIWLVSSPLGTHDAHARASDEADDVHTLTATAPSWIANDTLTEEDTRKLEPDERVWRREYAAIPQAGALGAFDEVAVRAAVDRDVGTIESTGPWSMILDPSSGGSDEFVWARARWVRNTAKREFLVFEDFTSAGQNFWGEASGEAIVTRIVASMKANGITRVDSDQRERLFLRAAFERHGIYTFEEHVWSAPAKVQAVETLRRLFRESAIVIPSHEKLIRQLFTFEEKILPSGQISYGGRKSDDYVAVLMTGALADIPRWFEDPVLYRGRGEPSSASYGIDRHATLFGRSPAGVVPDGNGGIRWGRARGRSSGGF